MKQRCFQGGGSLPWDPGCSDGPADSKPSGLATGSVRGAPPRPAGAERQRLIGRSVRVCTGTNLLFSRSQVAQWPKEEEEEQPMFDEEYDW